MTNFKTYQSLIEDAKSRIESNPTDTEYVNSQLIKIIEWQNEMMKLQSESDFKLSNKVYTFQKRQELKELIDTERKIAKGLYRATKIKAYEDYERWCWVAWNHYSDVPDEKIQDIRIENLKEFIIGEHCKWVAGFSKSRATFSNSSSNKSREAYYREEMLECLDQIKGIFKHGQTSLQENIK